MDGHLRLEDLLQLQGGLFGSLARLRAQSAEPRLATCIARLGDLGQVWPHVPGPGSEHGRAGMSGSASGLDEEECARRALAEGLERYSASVFHEEQFVSATALELGGVALDLETIPRCSRTELAHPRCPLTAPDPRAPLRWVRGLSLRDGREVYLPIVMVYLYAGFTGAGERICLPITTGCSAHASYERAVLSGLLEVVERDAISLVWLQRLALPILEVDDLPPVLAPFWERYSRSADGLEYLFFDATTDVGIPTVYGLQVAPAEPRATTLVACATDPDPAVAVAKVIADMASGRISFRHDRPVPPSWDDFTDVFHGATFMARAEQAPAFDFLRRSGVRRPLSRVPPLATRAGESVLAAVLRRLAESGLEAYVVDLSTDEALRCGMRVVRVLVPGLQPLSFHYRARYLGHPRLYDAPRRMGHPVHAEGELNEWPQPFD